MEELTESEAGISHVEAAEIGTPLAEAPEVLGDTTGRVRAQAAAASLQAWAPEEAVDEAEVVGADERRS